MGDSKTAVPATPRFAIGNRGSFFKRPGLDQGFTFILAYILNINILNPKFVSD